MIFTPERSHVLLVLVHSLIDNGSFVPAVRAARGDGA